MNAVARALSCIACALSTTGCYSFVEVPPTAIATGSTVRVTLSSEEALRQRDYLGELRTSIEGRVLGEPDADTLGVAVRSLEGSPADRPGFSTYVGVPRSGILRVEQKRLSVARTAAFAGAAAAVAAAVLAIATSSTGQKGEPPPSGELRVPIPIGF